MEFPKNIILLSNFQTTQGICQISPQKWATGFHQSRISNKNDHCCRCCQCLQEGWSHVFQCRSNSAQHTITTEVQALTALFNKFHCSAIFRECFLHGIQSWCSNTPVSFPFAIQQFTDSHFLYLQQAFSDQTTVVLEHVFCVRLVQSWFTSHYAYISSRTLPVTLTSQVFGPQLVKGLLSYSLSVWDSCNKFYYSATLQETSSKKYFFLTEKLTLVYEQQSQLHPLEASLMFTRPLAELLEMDIKYKHNWLNLYQIYLYPPSVDPSSVPLPPDPPPKPNTPTPSTLHAFFHLFCHLCNIILPESI